MSQVTTVSVSAFLRTAVVLAALTAVAACAPGYNRYQEPQKVSQSEPTVSYEYSNDAELIDANQQAAMECRKYNAVPETTDIANRTAGNRVITFTCVNPDAQTAYAPRNNPDLVFDYRTDQELIAASQEAEYYCRNRNMRLGPSDTDINPDGTKMVAFDCIP